MHIQHSLEPMPSLMHQSELPFQHPHALLIQCPTMTFQRRSGTTPSSPLWQTVNTKQCYISKVKTHNSGLTHGKSKSWDNSRLLSILQITTTQLCLLQTVLTGFLVSSLFLVQMVVCQTCKFKLIQTHTIGTSVVVV
jgi:hypothetical protein